jgi:cation transport protein ChaC
LIPDQKQLLFQQILDTSRQQKDLWIFAYASLIWRPEFEVTESRLARVHGWHRALQMWSRVNRGTPEKPGLVFALIQGGSCLGMAIKAPAGQQQQILQHLWEREMPTGVYQPKWIQCQTSQGAVQALAFTLPKSSPNYTGVLSDTAYRRIMADRVGGRFGHTLDYAQQTLQCLQELGIKDHVLAQLLKRSTQ